MLIPSVVRLLLHRLPPERQDFRVVLDDPVQQKIVAQPANRNVSDTKAAELFNTNRTYVNRARVRVDRPADLVLVLDLDLDRLEVTGTSTDTAVAGCRVDQPPPIRHLAEHGSKQGVDGKIG